LVALVEGDGQMAQFDEYITSAAPRMIPAFHITRTA